MDELRAVGERIAYYRCRQRLTQKVLAGFVGRSESWLAKIEQGDRTVEAIKDLLLLANVLKVAPSDLIGGIELPADGGDPLDPPRGLYAIRHAVLVERLPDRETPQSRELRARVERAKQLEERGSFEALGLELPGLIVDGRSAAARELPGTWWSLRWRAKWRLAWLAKWGIPSWHGSLPTARPSRGSARRTG